MKRRIFVAVLCLLFTLGVSSLAYARAGGGGASGKSGGNGGNKATAVHGAPSGSVDSTADITEGQLEDGAEGSDSETAGKNAVKKQEKEQAREVLKSGEGDGTEAGEGPKVRVRGKDINFDIPPVIKEGRTLIPVRAIMNGLGAEVTWDEAAKTVTIVRDGVTVVVTLDSQVITVNGEEQTIDVPAQLISNRTFVPIRFVAQALNMNVDWDEDTGTVDIGDGTDGTDETTDETTTDETTTDETTTDETTTDGTTTDETTTDGTTTGDSTDTTTDQTGTTDTTQQ